MVDEMLNEARRAPLYHATSIDKALDILEDGEILSRGLSVWDDAAYISTTRDRRLRYEWENVGGAAVQFVIDQERLSQRHRIIPHSHFGYIAAKAYTDMDKAMDAHRRQESEERIVGVSSIPLDYVTGIILHEPNEKIEHLALLRDIPVERDYA